ncbi:MAG: hypothetical protein H0Z33_11285 [Bacillaceae bacterium]|nr:hypothetical protein [Bacillaceae bacterium]
MENYLHPDAIEKVLGIKVKFGDMDNVPKIVADVLGWKESTVKKKLNNEVAAEMTLEQLNESDPNKEIEKWLKEIDKRISFYENINRQIAATKNYNDD